MDIDQLLLMNAFEIRNHFGNRLLILESGGDDSLPSTNLIDNTRTLGDVLESLGNPLKWCIYQRESHEIQGPQGDSKLLVAVVEGQIIPKGQLRLEHIRYAFGGAVDYQKIVDAYNKQPLLRLAKQVDLEKLTQDDFRLRGNFRVRDENYHGWKMIPEFRQEGTDAYMPLDQLFPEDRFHECYELIVQTPGCSQVAGSGYLHQSQRGDVSFGVRSGFVGQERLYSNSSPVWFGLLDDNYKPIVTETVDLIFVKISPWANETDVQRQRVLCD